MSFSEKYLKETLKICELMDPDLIEKMATSVAETRDSGGRMFFVGSGGGAGHASHAVCDFRKISNLSATPQQIMFLSYQPE